MSGLRSTADTGLVRLATFFEGLRCGFSGIASVSPGGGRPIYYSATRDATFSPGPTTPFQIASISKSFAAAAILLLQEAGHLSIDDPITRWLPDAPASWADVSVEHLLSHTSGIGHWADYPEIDLYFRSTPESMRRSIFGRELRFWPGSNWYYSSPGYVLASYVAELASGSPYSELLARLIFNPLQMAHTRAGHAPDGEKPQGFSCAKPVASFELETVGVGAGDIWSTASDMEAWDRAVLGQGLLNEASTAEMFRARAHAASFQDPPRRVAYGLGWVLEDLAGHRIAHHLGGNAGFGAFNA